MLIEFVYFLLLIHFVQCLMGAIGLVLTNHSTCFKSSFNFTYPGTGLTPKTFLALAFKFYASISCN